MMSLSLEETADSKAVDIKPLQLTVEAQENIKASALKSSVDQASNAIVKNKKTTIDVEVAGLTAEALVDAGATGSCLDAAFARKSQIEDSWRKDYR